MKKVAVTFKDSKVIHTLKEGNITDCGRYANLWKCTFWYQGEHIHGYDRICKSCLKTK